MGFLKSILSDALGDGISKAVSKAVEKTVAPAAEKLAQKQAEHLDKQAQVIEKATEDLGAATQQVDDAAETGKIKDPQTGEMREMTDEEKAQAKDAAQALKGLGSLFTGALAQAKMEAAAETAKKAAAEVAIFEKWEETLPAYPKWDVGGEAFELEEMMPMNGHPVYQLHLSGRPYLVELYAAKLRSAGFKAMAGDPEDLNADSYYKIIDEVCHVWNRSDACSDGRITVSFYVDNYRPAPKKETAAPADLKGLAKGIFKKLF